MVQQREVRKVAIGWELLISLNSLGPEPAFGRLGLGGSSEGTVLMGALLTPRFAPTALSSKD